MDLKIKSEEKILIVAPHPDDETIGCGGIMTLYGPQCDVLLLTDGRMGHLNDMTISEEELVALREREIQQVCKYAKIHKLSMLHIQDSALQENRAQVYSYDIRSYDLIFVPNYLESHCDHAVACEILLQMKKQQNAKGVIYEYEVWSPLTNPTHFLDLTKVLEKKIELLRLYKSQLICRDYERAVIGLGMYRGNFMRTEYAEAYSLYEKKSVRRRILDKVPYQARKSVHKLIGR